MAGSEVSAYCMPTCSIGSLGAGIVIVCAVDDFVVLDGMLGLA